MKTISKVITTIIVVLVLGLAAFVYFNFYFVLGRGVKAGVLNQVVYKGWVWKTYEGRLIMSGFRGSKSGSGIESNMLEFSVDDPEVAEYLMRCSGKHVELRYKEYHAKLPWRGRTHYIVDSVLSVSPASGDITDMPLVIPDTVATEDI